uniref:Uncharacterized protein n=1 Tax=Roseihalotalea indica TaxID=2867963 RepID=A0AA49JHV6_9BACT|nr:hypothetical protein K4G66_13535 [Tunicatimonas sp. TK19036]
MFARNEMTKQSPPLNREIATGLAPFTSLRSDRNDVSDFIPPLEGYFYIVGE